MHHGQINPTPPWSYDPAAPDSSLVSFSPSTCELHHSSCNTDWATAQSPTGTPGRVWTEGRVLALTNKPSISSWSDKRPQRPVTQSSDRRDPRVVHQCHHPSAGQARHPSQSSSTSSLGKFPWATERWGRAGGGFSRERGKRVVRRKEIRKSSDLQGWKLQFL